MKAQHRFSVIFLGFVVFAAWWYLRAPRPAQLVFGLGDTFEDVVKNSTYPVLAHANPPAEDPGDDKFGAIWVTEPAVIIRVTDPKHGFTLPATKFAALSFSENKALTLATSPMLQALPFDETVALLENLQDQFKAGGWQPWKTNGSTWFDLSPEGKKRLYARMFEPGYAETAILRVPGKYGMIFRFQCNEGCWTREPPYRFLIDIGFGNDSFGWTPDDAMSGKQPYVPAARK